MKEVDYTTWWIFFPSLSFKEKEFLLGLTEEFAIHTKGNIKRRGEGLH